MRRSVSASVGAVPVLLTSTVRVTSPPATGSTGTVVGLSSTDGSARVGEVAAVTSKGPPSCSQSSGVTRTATFSLSIHPSVVDPLRALASRSNVVDEVHVHAPWTPCPTSRVTDLDVDDAKDRFHSTSCPFCSSTVTRSMVLVSLGASKINRLDVPPPDARTPSSLIRVHDQATSPARVKG